MGLTLEGANKVTIVVAGASRRAEQRILMDTGYWDEIAKGLDCLARSPSAQEPPKLDLRVWLVGPEMDEAGVCSFA